MPAQLRKLGFVALLSTWLAFGGPSVIAYPPATNGWCYCYNPRSPYWYNYDIVSVIYYNDETYGPWQLVDQTNLDAGAPGTEFYYGFHAAEEYCFNHCLDVGVTNADHLCDVYGNANHHVQVLFSWHWEDTDGDLYNAGGDYNSGATTIIWCQ